MRQAAAIFWIGVVLCASAPPVSAGATPTCFGHPATIVGTSERDYLEGTDGDDVIVGLEGPDWVEGKGGRDIICGGSGGRPLGDYPEHLVGGAGADILVGGAGSDSLTGEDGADLLLGGVERDFLNGGDGSDLLRGGSHQDHVFGHRGDDRLQGQGGFDILGLDAGNDVIIGAQDGRLGDYLVYGGAPRPVHIDLNEGTARGWGRDRLIGIENVSAWDGDASTRSYADTIIGDSGINDIDPGGAADVVRAGPGDDCLVGSEGGDRLDGGRGFDMFTTFYCDVEAEAWSLAPGRADGGLFIDLEEGRAVSEFTGTDVVVRFEGAFGTINPDEMWGDGATNRFFGHEGNDELHGRSGDDELNGSAGADSADGGEGSDMCIGIEVPVSCE